MSAAEAFAAACAAGIQISIDGDDLVLQASAPPPAEVLDLLATHKAAIVTLLRPGNDGWSAADWQEYFEERAGIGEFEGGLPRDQAQAQAFSRCVGEWLQRAQQICAALFEHL
jgi:hypothetical protein